MLMPLNRLLKCPPVQSRLYAFIFVWGGASDTIPLITPQTEYALLAYDQHFAAPTGNDTLTADAEIFPTFYGFCGIPTPRIVQRLTVVAVEANVVLRRITLHNTLISGSLLQRYGMFFGGELLNHPVHELFLFALAGVASDFKNPAGDALYIQPVIDWHMNLRPGLTVGLGAQFLYNFDRWSGFFSLPFAPLLTICWQISPKTTLKFAWDNLVIRYYLCKRLCIAGEGKYIIRWFRLAEKRTYEFENIWIGAGPDIRITGDIYLRLRAFFNLTARETVLTGEQEIASAEKRRGWGARVICTYAK